MADQASPRGKHAASSTERVRKHRAAMRGKGLRPVTLWLPDLADAAIRADYAAQSVRIAASEDSHATQLWLDHLTVELWNDPAQ
jgi:hypothetical protein